MDVRLLSIAVSFRDMLRMGATYELASDAMNWFLHRVCARVFCFDLGGRGLLMMG
jgi:hypothetical protein